MLETLIKYSHGAEPGFKPKDIRWSIILDSHKGFLGLIQLGNPDQKINRGLTFVKCPDLSQPELISGSETRSHFLVDTASVVALYEKPPTSKTKKKHTYFVKLLSEAGLTLPPLAIIANFLKDKTTLKSIQATMTEYKVKPTDKVSIQLDHKFPVQEEYWHDWWRKFRFEFNKSYKKQKKTHISPPKMRCFATGELTVPMPTHNKIEGLFNVGGQSSGDVLIGFDKDAFQSYGLKQSENAAVSENAVAAYCSGLNDLIKNHSQQLVRTKIVHWFSKNIPEDDDPLNWLIESTEQTAINAQHLAHELLTAIREGKRPDLANNYYHILVLSGVSGRTMVRDWAEGQFEQLVSNVNNWFNDLEIIRRDGDFPIYTPKLNSILDSMISHNKEKLPTPIISKIWRLAVFSEPIPYSILTQALIKRKMEIIQPDKGSINSVGMGLIKAYHLRKNRKEGNTKMVENLTPALSENFPSPAYQCGRLMAVLARLQQAALGDVGAGVVQRYYGSASTTPELVLGRLIHHSQYHLAKLDQGFSHWFESLISNILDKVPPQNLPKTLSLEDQSLFALGYYQQLANMNAKQSNKAKKENK